MARALGRTMIIWWNMIIEHILSSGSGWANNKILLHKPCNPHKSYNQCTCWHNINKQQTHTRTARYGRFYPSAENSKHNFIEIFLWCAASISSNVYKIVVEWICFKGGKMQSKVGDRRYVKKEIDHFKKFSQNIIIYTTIK